MGRTRVSASSRPEAIIPLGARGLIRISRRPRHSATHPTPPRRRIQHLLQSQPFAVVGYFHTGLHNGSVIGDSGD